MPPLAIVCTSQIPAGHQLALVTLRAVQGIVVRDVTDLTHPVTRCGLSGGDNVRFINSTRISYIVTSSGDLGAAGSLYLVGEAMELLHLSPIPATDERRLNEWGTPASSSARL